MKKQALAVITIIMAGIIAGCGGGGTSTSANPSDSTTTAISGKVADGYLANATVFMDKNGNYQLDSGEPSATTDANGAYTLKVAAADVGKYPIVAIATKGVTIDKDTNTTVASTYVMSMPATATSGTVNSSNFISPMSSILNEMMNTGNFSSMQQAMNDLAGKIGMPIGTNMMGDYIAGNNTTLHTAAQNMAGLMGSQMGLVTNTNGSTTTVDVNRYRSMMGTIYSNMPTVMGSGSNTSTANSNLTGTMMANITNVTPGQPFRNMSSAFRGGMMGIR